eukprot:5375503-Pleurochrysis_carterae.AAC.1
MEYFPRGWAESFVCDLCVLFCVLVMHTCWRCQTSVKLHLKVPLGSAPTRTERQLGRSEYVSPSISQLKRRVRPAGPNAARGRLFDKEA